MKNKGIHLLCRRTAPKPLDTEKHPPIVINEFNDKEVAAFHKSIMQAISDPDSNAIPVIVDSYGGELYAVFGMIDIIESIGMPVATIGMGKAMSCGSLLLAAGTKGHRFAAPNLDILIHEASSGSRGKNTDVQNEARASDRLNKVFLEKLAALSGKKPSFYQDMLHAHKNVDLYISPKEAKKYGIVDHIGIPILMEA